MTVDYVALESALALNDNKPALVALSAAAVHRLWSLVGGRWEVYQAGMGYRQGIAVTVGSPILTAIQATEEAVTFTLPGEHYGAWTVVRYLPPAPGDMNRDGRLSAGDAVILLRMALGDPRPSAGDVVVGDLSGDGRLSVADAQTLVNRLVGR